jgi:hypothetical protein
MANYVVQGSCDIRAWLVSDCMLNPTKVCVMCVTRSAVCGGQDRLNAATTRLLLAYTYLRSRLTVAGVWS